MHFTSERLKQKCKHTLIPKALLLIFLYQTQKLFKALFLREVENHLYAQIVLE